MWQNTHSGTTGTKICWRNSTLDKSVNSNSNFIFKIATYTSKVYWLPVNIKRKPEFDWTDKNNVNGTRVVQSIKLQIHKNFYLVEVIAGEDADCRHNNYCTV